MLGYVSLQVLRNIGIPTLKPILRTRGKERWILELQAFDRKRGMQARHCTTRLEGFLQPIPRKVVMLQRGQELEATQGISVDH